MLYRPVFIFGGAGSLGRTLTKRFREQGSQVVVFSRDEAKHHKMAQEFKNVHFEIGDIRDYDAVYRALHKHCPHTIINAAAIKQVPACESHPYEALKTNTIGTYNLVKAIENRTYVNLQGPIRILSVSTDKACKPVNSYGMTKGLQERIHLNGSSHHCVFNCVRYGNVLESTGSVIPFFKDRLLKGLDLPVTHEDMTRFLLSLDQSVDLIFEALNDDRGKRIFIPVVPSAKIMDLAEIMLEHYQNKSKIVISGVRPGEKIDEILVSEEELSRTKDAGDHYIIHDINQQYDFKDLTGEYSSKTNLMDKKQLKEFLLEHGAL